MFILSIICPPIDTNAYLIGCERTKQAAIIDPGFDAWESVLPILEKEGYELKMILCTHSHWDHIGEVTLIKKKLDIPVYVHEADAFNLIQPGQDGLPCPFSIEGCTPTHLLKAGDKIVLGELSATVLYTPGHSVGSVCFYFPTEEVLFSGDTLFKGSMGKISFPTSEPSKMKNSLLSLYQLPKSTKVYPGHGPETSIGQESWINKL